MIKKELQQELNRTKLVLDYARQEIEEKDKEIERLNKAREIDIEYNKYLQKEIIRLNNIINKLEKDIKNLYTYGIKNNAEQKDYLLNRLQELKGSDK